MIFRTEDIGLDECDPGEIYAKIISRGKISELKNTNQIMVMDDLAK